MFFAKSNDTAKTGYWREAYFPIARIMQKMENYHINTVSNSRIKNSGKKKGDFRRL